MQGAAKNMNALKMQGPSGDEQEELEQEQLPAQEQEQQQISCPSDRRVIR